MNRPNSVYFEVEENWKEEVEEIPNLSVTNGLFFMKKKTVSDRQTITFKNLSQLNLIDDKLYVWAIGSPRLLMCCLSTDAERSSFTYTEHADVCRLCGHHSTRNVSIQVRDHLFRGANGICSTSQHSIFFHCALAIGFIDGDQ